MIINATTDNGEVLTDFEVFIDNSPNKTDLGSDNKTTVSNFPFGSNLFIEVKKKGYMDANETSYLVQDIENIIHLNLPIKRVSLRK